MIDHNLIHLQANTEQIQQQQKLAIVKLRQGVAQWTSIVSTSTYLEQLAFSAVRERRKHILIL